MKKKFTLRELVKAARLGFKFHAKSGPYLYAQDYFLNPEFPIEQVLCDWTILKTNAQPMRCQKMAR